MHSVCSTSTLILVYKPPNANDSDYTFSLVTLVLSQLFYI